MSTLTIEQKLALVVKQLDEYFPILEERVLQLEEDNARSARIAGKLMLRIFDLEARLAEFDGKEIGGVPLSVKDDINRLIANIGDEWGFKEANGDPR